MKLSKFSSLSKTNFNFLKWSPTTEIKILDSAPFPPIMAKVNPKPFLCARKANKRGVCVACDILEEEAYSRLELMRFADDGGRQP